MVTDAKKLGLRCWVLSVLLIQSINSNMVTVEGHQGQAWVDAPVMNGWASRF